MVGAIIGLELPRTRRLDTFAGRELFGLVKSFSENIPIVLQSEDEEKLKTTDSLAFKLWKGSECMHHELRKIMREICGFGSFVFVDPRTGVRLIRAHDISQLAFIVGEIDIETLERHAGHNHFSNWLSLHGHEELAMKLRPLKVNPETHTFLDEHGRDTGINIRNYLLKEFEPYLTINDT